MTTVSIKDRAGTQLVTLTLPPDTTIQSLKSTLATQLGVPCEKLLLGRSTKQECTDDQTLTSLNQPEELLVLPTSVWLKYRDEEQGRDYYFDPQARVTEWSLPVWATAILGPEGDDYELLESFQPSEKHLKYSHLLRPNSWLEGKRYLERPARKQIDKPFIKDYAYQQGDDEYNFWFDKYLNDKPVRDRAPASTRCDLELDVGYTKADLMEPETAYWCLHFVRGCCSEGANCRFFHRLPSVEECKRIAHTKDIFGRTRHAAHRDDMGGIGCFQKECRTLCACDVKIPPGSDQVEQVNEMLWRHFSLWGRVEDITFIPSKCLAFIKYYHRCFAEVAKEAMRNQPLDYDEILMIKWANDDPNAAKESQYSEAWHKAQIQVEKEKKIKKSGDKKPAETEAAPIASLKPLPEPINISQYEAEMQELASSQSAVMHNSVRMQQVLHRIHSDQISTLNQIIYPAHLQPSTNPPDDLPTDEPLAFTSKKRRLG
jgi:hypothetical protein